MKEKNKNGKKEIIENIKWFKKFPLEKRLLISEIDRKSTEILRSLSIKGYAKLKRAD